MQNNIKIWINIINEKIEAKIVADSINSQGDRITTYLLTFPRFILAELNTHRVFSKNSASSRAIPFEKMVEAIEKYPFIPIAFQKNHKGMQGIEYLQGEDLEEALDRWNDAKNYAIESAKDLYSVGVTKQLCNRLLEPWMWTTMLITGNVNETGWLNFFKLRCPKYNWQNKGEFKSWKSLVKSHFDNGASRDWVDGLENTSILNRLKNNKGQAEIHMMALAEAIYDVINKSTPDMLNGGDWHIPFSNTFDMGHFSTPFHGIDYQKMVKVSAAMAARTSYTVIGEEKEIDYQKLIELHDKLISQNPPHSSPLSHCARCMTDEDYNVYIKGKFDVYYVDMISDKLKNIDGISNLNSFGWCRNLKGFIPYRAIIEEHMKF